MAEILANGLRFHVQRLGPSVRGDQPTVVFIHGLVIDNLSSFYYALARSVAQRGTDVILYDLRGHGRSERPPAGYTVRDAVADLVAILDQLGTSLPVHLVGNSFGGMVAANVALAHPERVAGLVLIEAPCAGEVARRWIENIANTLNVGALGLEHDQTREQLEMIGWRRLARQANLADALLNHTTIIDDLAATDPLEPTRLNDVACPVLSVYGERSELAAAASELPSTSDWVVEILPGDVAHNVLRDANSDLCRVVLRWLAQRNRPAQSVGARPGGFDTPAGRSR
jgi:pimeloyl-ACP methyl ester carboxylesterase